QDEATVLLTQQAQYTYAQLRHAVGAVARFLHQNGSGPGQCVLVVAENSFFAVAAYLGAIYAGAVAVPLPTNLAAAQCATIRSRTRADFAFVQAKVWEDFKGCLGDLSHIVIDGSPSTPNTTAWTSLLDDAGKTPGPMHPESQDALAVLLF